MHGGNDGTRSGLGDGVLAETPPPPVANDGIAGSLDAVICLTFANPAAITS